MKRDSSGQATFRDPVCGMEVSYRTAVEECRHGDKTYYFCSSGCREQFQAEPQHYLRSHRQRGSRRP